MNLLDEIIEKPGGEDYYQYSQNEALLQDVPPNTWLVDLTLREIVVGTSLGPVVLLQKVSYDICTTMEDGTRYCEGDIFNIAITAVEIASLQLAKLQTAGYHQ